MVNEQRAKGKALRAKRQKQRTERALQIREQIPDDKQIKSNHEIALSFTLSPSALCPLRFMI